MPEEFVRAVTDQLEAARREPGVGLLADFSNDVAVQYQVNPGQVGSDGRALMAVEIVSR